MHRREFTLQLYDGKPPIVPPLKPQSSQELEAVAPTWRCSGCLMAWGVYGPTTADARPEGEGCPFCDNIQTWMADSPAARMIDQQSAVPEYSASLALSTMHSAAPFAIQAAEHAIKQGHYHRLTRSSWPMIERKVIAIVKSTLTHWLSREDNRKVLHPIGIEFHDGELFSNGHLHGMVAAMTVSVRMGYVGQAVDACEEFKVRYRWVQ